MYVFLKRLVDIRQEETAALFWAFLYHFVIMGSYYILKPLRDSIGLAHGADKLPDLFVVTMVVMLAVNPLYSILVSRLPRSRLIPLVYRFFIVNLLIFWGLFHAAPSGSRLLDLGFFVWVSLFNLFAVSVFWGFMADVFKSDQGKRLFGFVGAGGTLGQMAGSSLTSVLASRIGNIELLLCSMVLLEISVLCVRKLVNLFQMEAAPKAVRADSSPGSSASPAPTRGAGPFDEAMEGIRLMVKSRYLLGICGYMFLYTFTSSFLYFQKGQIVESAIQDDAARTAFFANVNLGISALTLVVQLLVTGTLIRSLGVSLSLGLVPLVTVIGFGILAQSPVLVVFAVIEVMRTGLNYAVARPSRELLYTVVSREEKYKSKSFIDTFIYRGGDTLAAGAFKWLTSRYSLGLTGIFLAGIPFAVVWLVISLALGRVQARKADAIAAGKAA